MKIILTSFGSYGDVYPFIWMAKVLNNSGHHAIIITNSVFQDIIEKNNIDFYGTGNVEEYNGIFESIDVTSKKNKPGEIVKNLKKFINYICFDPIDETVKIINDIKTTDTLILNSMLAFGAGLAAKKYSLSQRTIALSPSVISSFQESESIIQSIYTNIKNKMNTVAYKMLYGKHIKKITDSMGIELAKPTYPDWIFNNGTLCLFPNWFMNFTPKQNKQLHFIGFPEIDDDSALPDDFLEFMKTNPDPIVFTPGTPFRHNSHFFDEALNALSKMGKPGVYLTKNIKSIPENLPTNIYVSDFLPLHKFLDQCCLIVHHGGIGTTAQAVNSGVPQIIFYHQGLDQKQNGKIVENMETAKIADYSELNSAIIIEYANELITSNVKERCNLLKDKNKIKSSKNEFINLIKKIND